MTTATTITADEAKDLVSQQLSRFADDPDAFPAALAARAVMPHRYSVANMMLILSQANDPDVLADRIMPRTEWAKLGYLPAGLPVAIWSKPMTGHRLPDGTVTFKKTADPDAKDFHTFRLEPTYPAAAVRDAQGNTGAETGEPLTGEPAELYGRLAGWLTGQGWTLEERNVDGAGGWTSHAGRVIRIDPRFTGWDRVRVIVHEATHALMHEHITDYNTDHRGDYEAEADGVAFAILTAYGQTEAAGRTVRYVANWAAKDTARVQAAVERASAALDAIVDVLAGEADVTVRTPKTGKADNKELAEWLRSEGLPVRGAVWAAAKAGERDLGKLGALAETEAIAA